MRAPLDHENPAAGQIELAVTRVVSTDPAARQGSLFVDFGGPGSSGTAGIEAWAAGLDPRVRAAYDIVGFDPRGVGSSTAVECVDDATMDAMRAGSVDPDTPEGLAQAVAAAERFAAACVANTGPLLGEVDTASAARDMDILRAALNEEQIDYLGYSYGTFLGAMYADLFPEHSGRFVLDAAMDPSLGDAGLTLDARLQQTSPALGDWFSHGAVSCGAWSHEPVREPAPMDAAGAGPDRRTLRQSADGGRKRPVRDRPAPAQPPGKSGRSGSSGPSY